jgi:hypothetical protein
VEKVAKGSVRRKGLRPILAHAARRGQTRALEGAAAARHHAPVPHIAFTPQLRRFLDAPEVHSPASTLRAALEDAFARNPPLRGYVLDDQGHLRPNVAVFVDGRRCRDAIALSDPLSPDSRVYVLQALSGG